MTRMRLIFAVLNLDELLLWNADDTDKADCRWFKFRCIIFLYLLNAENTDKADICRFNFIVIFFLFV